MTNPQESLTTSEARQEAPAKLNGIDLLIVETLARVLERIGSAGRVTSPFKAYDTHVTLGHHVPGERMGRFVEIFRGLPSSEKKIIIGTGKGIPFTRIDHPNDLQPDEWDKVLGITSSDTAPE